MPTGCKEFCNVLGSENIRSLTLARDNLARRHNKQNGSVNINGERWYEVNETVTWERRGPSLNKEAWEGLDEGMTWTDTPKIRVIWISHMEIWDKSMLESENSYITLSYIKKGLHMECKGKLFMEHSETFYGKIK